MPLTLRITKAWLYYLVSLLLVLLSFSQGAHATHLRAGNIFAESDPNNYLKWKFTLITYSVLGGFQDESATLYFGDCTSQEDATPVRTILNNGQNNTQINVFEFEHTYAGAGTFKVSYIGENRNGGVVNISNSVQQTFYLETVVTIDPFLGINRSPILQYEPIDLAAQNQVFVHNPAAFDPDGDSLAFKMLVPRGEGSRDACGNPIPQVVPGYRGLEQFLGIQDTSRPPVGFSLNVFTGQITWNTPSTVGEFNLAFIVEEWRDNRLIGTVVRDMQIRVLESLNRPPKLFIPRDTCVIAGTFLIDTVKASDPDRHPIVMEAYGSMLAPRGTATFPKFNDTTHVFKWQTTCNDVRREPYQVVFRAEDRPPAGLIRLVDLQPWRITVVGPPPVLNTAIPESSSSIRLTWENYTCPNATIMYIYRREGPSTWEPSTCETGIPGFTGYVLVGQVEAGVVTFLDNNNGQGLERNRTYCYRIYAGFPSGGESIASNEMCASLESISLTKVSVLETGATNGQIRVEWSKPGAIVNQLTPPLRYRLLRAEGQIRSVPFSFTEIYTTTNLNDTVYTDRNLNTQEKAYSYRIEFYHSSSVGSPTVLVDSSSASSVRLEGVANGTTMQLNWTYSVPWNNASTAAAPLYHVVFLRLPGSNEFVRYDSTLAGPTSGTFSREVPLQEGEQYCAFVVTRGMFMNPRLPNPILNNSQIDCFSRPCVPVLAIDPLVCDENFKPNGPPFQNVLTWNLANGCDASAIDFYTLYYKPTDDGEFVAIATVKSMSYIHQNLLFYSGCYMVTATDMFGNESEPSNTVCKDNCINFVLPNIITPNNDGKNDTFKPKQGAAFIKSAKLQVYNRWGNKVFEGTDRPDLNWAGTDNNGNALADGVYFYQVEVEFYGRSAEADRRTFKGWVEVIR